MSSSSLTGSWITASLQRMLVAGTRLEHYEILSSLGAGGMGEVYRARDTKLGRNVALKLLPEVFAEDPERLSRFQREAQVLASLNHPNIAQIYAIEDRALVMELVPGKTLKRLPIETALEYAKQIADALEALDGDETLDLLELRPQTERIIEIGLPASLGGPHFKDYGDHVVSP